MRDRKRYLMSTAAIAVLFAMSSSSTTRADTFPPAGTDVVWHVLRVDLDIGDNGTTDETLVFNGRMRLTRGAPFTNPGGYRQIDFQVSQWRASAWSTTFGDSIHYQLAMDTTQAFSSIVADSVGQDYPCTFTFNVIFDAYLGSTRVYRHHHGRPKGYPFRHVPPDGDPQNSPTITEFEATRIVVQHPTLGTVSFKPKDCNDQNGMTVGIGEQPGPELWPLRIWPSPSTGPSNLSFTLARSARISGEIFDLSGRRLRRLEFGTLSAGPHQRRWDGKDTTGRPLPGGVYVVRLLADGRQIGVMRFVVKR